MTTLTFPAEQPLIRVEDDGTVRIGRTRVILAVYLNAYRDWGWSAEQLAEQFPTVSLAESHAVLAYYLNHRPEVDAYLDDWNTEGEDLRAKWLGSSEGQQLQARVRTARLSRTRTDTIVG